MQIKNVSDFRQAMRHGPYAWPGAYPVYFIMMDGEPLSFEAAKLCRRDIVRAIADQRHGYRDAQWIPVEMAINYEDFLLCSHLGIAIERAYGDE